jgi:hypothetical protein
MRFPIDIGSQCLPRQRREPATPEAWFKSWWAHKQKNSLHMKHLILAAVAAFSISSLAFTTGDPCGVISLGAYKSDLTAGTVTAIPKDKLVASVKEGISLAGTSKCPGTYSIIDMQLTIEAARDVRYEYNHATLAEMQGMDEFMLVRYFNDANKLIFHGIKAKNSSGEIIEFPSVSFSVQ